MQKTFSTQAGYVSDNEVRLLRGGAEYFRELHNMIHAAKESLHLQTYIFDGDETGTQVIEALSAAAVRGVKVYVMLDGYASRQLSDTHIAKLRSSGVHFRWFQPLFKSSNFFFGRRMHHKIVVSDAWRSLVGGLNISDRYNDMPGEPAWLDWAVTVTGQTSVELYNRCVQMWFRRPPTWSQVPAVKRAAIDDCLVRVRINDSFRNKNQISRSYMEMLRHAQSEVMIMSSYFMPGRKIRKHLRLASGRGIKIRVILTKISDVAVAKQAERFFYPWLLRRGVEIYEYRRKVLHGKLAICDNVWVTVGSYNLNDLSAYASIELNLEIHNATFSIDASNRLNQIIQNDCDQITEESLNRSTHWWNKLLYRLAYGVGRLFLFVFIFPFSQERTLDRK